ncbi:hypothetical protein G6F36_013289 [Rhizopus arrhizus]|nr:hypothetical protein G6F36_013289 [Rhizopus arrhizus]
MIITRDQALCMLFCVEFTPENVAHSEQKIADFGEIDICYEKDLKNPFMNSIVKINGDPFTYQRYVISAPTNASNEILSSETQVVQFLNETHLPIKPGSSHYSSRSI